MDPTGVIVLQYCFRGARVTRGGFKQGYAERRGVDDMLDIPRRALFFCQYFGSMPLLTFSKARGQLASIDKRLRFPKMRG